MKNIESWLCVQNNYYFFKCCNVTWHNLLLKKSQADMLDTVKRALSGTSDPESLFDIRYWSGK